MAVKYGQYNIVKWLLHNNVHPNVEGANYACQTHRVDILILLMKYHILYDTQGANIAASNGNLDILKLYRIKVLPNKDGVNLAAKNSRFNVLRWLKIYGMAPDYVIKEKRRTHNRDHSDTLHRF